MTLVIDNLYWNRHVVVMLLTTASPPCLWTPADRRESVLKVSSHLAAVQFTTYLCRLPVESDYLVAYSVLPGYISWIEPYGSWYLTLCHHHTKLSVSLRFAIYSQVHSNGMPRPQHVCGSVPESGHRLRHSAPRECWQIEGFRFNSHPQISGYVICDKLIKLCFQKSSRSRSTWTRRPRRVRAAHMMKAFWRCALSVLNGHITLVYY